MLTYSVPATSRVQFRHHSHNLGGLSVKNISTVLIGLSSYGAGYARLLIEQGQIHNACLAGIVDPYAEKNPYWPMVKEHKIPRYDTLPEFTARHQADLAVIASPIHLHCPQTCSALQAGLPVLCEKPIGGAIQEVHRMSAAREQAGKFVAIGYNWSFVEGIQALKRDIMKGLFGRPVRFKTIVLWPRPITYYNRNNWAGRLRSPAGDWILDSPVNNAAAHFLHNMFYLLGPDVDASAMPAEVTAELYRANDIENYDTACLRTKTNSGVDIMFVTSHAADQKWPIRFEFVFERAKVAYEQGSCFRAVFNDKRIKNYAAPDDRQHLRDKLRQSVAAVRSGSKLLCGLEAAMAQTLCMNGAQESMAGITVFPHEMIKRRQMCFDETGNMDEHVVVTGLVDVLGKCYESWQLPSERGISWAKAGSRVDLSSYVWYPGGKRP